VFETVVERCIAEGLVGGEGFAIDASIIRADANRRRGVPSTATVEWLAPEQRSRAVRDYLASLDEAEPVGATPKILSMTDPAARWTAAPGCPAFHACSTNYLVDVESGVIVDVEATAAHRTEETEATKAMIERSDGTFAVSDFQWDEQANEYRCPRGEALRSQWRAFSSPRGLRVTCADTVIYRATQQACAACPMKPRCCPNTPTRKIARSLYEKSREVARRRPGPHSSFLLPHCYAQCPPEAAGCVFQARRVISILVTRSNCLLRRQWTSSPQ
jgi:hypothetical protein